MYLRTVLRSWPVRRAMAATVSPCWARSRIMTSSPSVTTASSHDAGRHLGVDGRPAPGPGRCAEPRKFRSALLGSIHPAATGLELMPGLSHPGAQGRELAVNRLLALLALGGDPCIGGGAHGSSPPVSGSVVRRR